MSVSTSGLVVDITVSDLSLGGSLGFVFILIGFLSASGISLLNTLGGDDLFGLSNSLSVGSISSAEWILSWLLELKESSIWSSSPQVSSWVWLMPEIALSLGISSSGDMSEQRSRGSFVSLVSRVDISLLCGFISLLGGDNLGLNWLVLDKLGVGKSKRISWGSRSIITLDLGIDLDVLDVILDWCVWLIWISDLLWSTHRLAHFLLGISDAVKDFSIVFTFIE